MTARARTSSYRVSVVLSHPVPYFAPFFARLTAEPWIDLTVLYSSTLGTEAAGAHFKAFGRQFEWDMDLLSGYRHKFLWNPPGAHPERPWSLISPAIVGEMRAHRCDVVVSFGWSFPVNIVAIAAARKAGIPILLYSDSDVRYEARRRSRRAQGAFRKAICRRAAGAFYAGTHNREFYLRYGVSPDRLWFSPIAADNDRFAAADGNAVRRRLRLRSDVCYFLFAGTLIERKRPLMAADAIAALQREGLPAGLIIAGSGEMEGKLRNRIEELGMRDTHLLGFVNQADLPSVYASADVLVLPSHRDPNPLVVKEAMAAGKPVVVSSGTGVWGPEDLVRDGREGIVFDRDAFQSLLDACRSMVEPGARRTMAGSARERIGLFSYDVALAGWRAAIETVAEER